MMGRTHALAGVTMAMAAQPLLAVAGVDGVAGPCATLMFAIGGAGGSMLPDMDHQHATVARCLGPVSKLLCIVIGKASGGHRNGTHSLLGIACFTALSWWLCTLGGWPAALWAGFLLAVGSAALHLTFSKGSAIAHTLLCLAGSAAVAWQASNHPVPWQALTWGVLVGVCSHVLFPTDSLTKEGCPWLWPLNRRRFHFANLTTDHFTENNVVWWLLVAALGCVVTWRTGHWQGLSAAAGWVRSHVDQLAPAQGAPRRR